MNFLYIDPGMGSMVIQVIIGAIAAGSATLYMFKQKFASLFKRSAQEDAISEMEAE